MWDTQNKTSSIYMLTELNQNMVEMNEVTCVGRMTSWKLKGQDIPECQSDIIF